MLFLCISMAQILDPEAVDYRIFSIYFDGTNSGPHGMEPF